MFEPNWQPNFGDNFRTAWFGGSAQIVAGESVGRITEAGDQRITEAGDDRVTEGD